MTDIPPTVFPAKMHRLTMAMIDDGGVAPWEDQMATAAARDPTGWNAAALLHMVDAIFFGIGPGLVPISRYARDRSREILAEHLAITQKSDRGRKFWQRWTDPKFYKLSRLRDALREADSPDPSYNIAIVRRAAERYFSHVPEDIVERWHQQGRP